MPAFVSIIDAIQPTGRACQPGMRGILMPDRQRLFKLWNPAKRVFRGIFMTLVTLWLLVFAVGLLLTAYEVGGLPAVLIVICVIASGAAYRMRKAQRHGAAPIAPVSHESAMPAFDLPASHSLTLTATETVP